MAGAPRVLSVRLTDLDPFLAAFRLLTSVRFALALIAFLAGASMLGVLLPQIPTQMRTDPAAVAGWLAFQEERYGSFTRPMYSLGLFDVFRSLWFITGLGVLVLSVCVCTANRLPPIWRNVTRPQSRVSDDYFQRSSSAIEFPALDGDALATELRRRRYRVKASSEGAVTYLFADRFPWAQMATFVSHLALILFLGGGLVTILTARETNILIAEGESRPIFSLTDDDHMQLYVKDAIGRFDSTGFPLDYRSELTVFKDGTPVVEGFSTVNDPLGYNGYKFHQTAYFPDGAALQVRDVVSGRLLYDEILALTDRTPTPRLSIRDAATGEELFGNTVMPTDFIGNASGGVITLPEGRGSFWVGTQPAANGSGWQLAVLEPGADHFLAVLGLEQSSDVRGLRIEFTGLTDVASVAVSSLPGAPQRITAQLLDQPEGPVLTLTPVNGLALGLVPGEPIVIGDYEYSFQGRREFTGITVRRDPGTNIIWIATGLLLLGLMLTFYTPRRRMWVRIGEGRALFRALGGRASDVEREVAGIIERARG